MIIQQPKNPRLTREMKIVIPIDLHIQLHHTKILYGERISGVVERALETYFRNSGLVARPSGDDDA